MLNKLKYYLQLTKSLQTGLLMLTGLSGYFSAGCPVYHPCITAMLTVVLFLTIGGSTLLNMVYDKDIDRIMNRTRHRPLPSGKVTSKETLMIGTAATITGLLLAFGLSPLFGAAIFAGVFSDVVVYTLWLKRKTPWSIVWGGISGGMPILAGRILGTGQIDFIGIMMSLSILLWIPTHILTFSIKYDSDYRKAGIPTFASSYGYAKTRLIIALSALGAAASIGLGAMSLGLAWGYIRLLGVLSFGLLSLAVFSIYKPSDKVNFGLFKYASFYMMGAMILIAIGTAS